MPIFASQHTAAQSQRGCGVGASHERVRSVRGERIVCASLRTCVRDDTDAVAADTDAPI
jgi:hypothetical protein